MKNYNIIFVVLIAILISGCEKYEEYKIDFDYSTVYFPYQNPVRTVVMGMGLDFQVGVVLGGRRDNQQQEIVKFEIDHRLLNDTDFDLLPSEYYSLSNNSEMVISPGSIFGRITVDLDSAAFVNDSLSYRIAYALPFRITEATVDSVLQGEYNETTERYDIEPKDYTIVVIRYINSYHGIYYHKGIEYVYDTEGNPVDTAVYSFSNLVKNFTWNLETIGPNKLITSGIGEYHSGDYAMKLIIDGSNVSIENVDDSLSIVTSVSGKASIYNQDKREFYLNYSYTDGEDYVHQVTDTLVFRDRGLSFETW